jgi:hypothetical protein
VKIAAFALGPLLLLAALLAFVAAARPGATPPPAPIESLAFERTVLAPGVITLHLRNTGPEPLSVVLVSVNDSIWPATVSPESEIARLGTATLTLRDEAVRGPRSGHELPDHRARQEGARDLPGCDAAGTRPREGLSGT